tara:strand:- start:376 stop:921 length:546 start_codon:yes stop_codon:yes gene_type:complete
MGKLKTVNIKGKQYVEVNERLIYFRKNYPKFTLTSEVLEKTDKSILILATILDEKGRAIADGMAEEEKGSSFINKTSYVENCQTSAWGRALGNFGIGLDTAVASADEVKNAIRNQDKVENKTTAKDLKKKKIVLDIGDENWSNVLKYISKNKALGLAKLIPQLETKYSIKVAVKKELAKHS